MTNDATFEDGAEQSLRLRAEDTDDLQVIASLIQDAVFPVTELRWDRTRHRLVLLINRFRWEDKPGADRRGHTFERVQSLLAIDSVLQVQSQGIDRSDKDLILSLLTVEFEPGEDGGGQVVLTLAGDGAIAARVEALDVILQDVTRPYQAPSRQAPEHKT